MDLFLSFLAAAGFTLAAVLISKARGRDELDRVMREHATTEAGRTEANGGA